MAKLNSGMVCIKYFLFTMNFIFVLMGIMAITAGSAILMIYQNFEAFLEFHHLRPSEVLIAIGAIIFFISFIGCIGAIKESTMLVNLYALLLFLLLILELSAGIAAFVMRWELFDDIKDNMMNALQDYTRLDSAERAWDFTQKHMHCCGVEYPHDWAPEHVRGHVVIIEGQIFTVPLSCCNNVPKFCTDIYKQGCLDVMENYVSTSSLALGYVGIIITTIQLLGVVIAYMLAKAVRRVKTEQEIERQQNRERFSQQRAAEIEQRVTTSALFIPTSSSTDA